MRASLFYGIGEYFGIFFSSLIDLPFSFLLDTLTFPYIGFISATIRSEPINPDSMAISFER